MDERLQVARELASLTTKVDACQKAVDKLSHALLGNGTAGLLTRVDRLEQSRHVRTRFFWFGLTCLSGIVGAAVSKLF